MLHKFLIRSYCEELGDIPLPYFCFPPLLRSTCTSFKQRNEV